jgi:hypothetical protein
VQNAWDDQLRGTTAEPRVYVNGTAPANAVGVYVRMTSPSGNESAVWHAGALLLERYPTHGRYFDGDPSSSQGDGYWGTWDKVNQVGLGIPHNSTSSLHGDKIIELWELRDNNWFRKYLVSDTIVSLDAAKLTGAIDGRILLDNSLAPDKQMAPLVIASEALSYGDLVNIWNNSNIPNVRKADAAQLREAHGYVLESCTAGQSVHVYHLGFVPYDPDSANLPTGSQWLSATTPGQLVNRPPSSAGQIVQRVGVVPSRATFDFHPGLAIRII